MFATYRKKLGWSAAAAALVTSVLVTFGAIAPASAAGPDIDPTQPGSVTINKQRATSSFSLWAVTSQTTTGAPDVTTNAGWDEINALFTAVGSNPSAGALNSAGYNLVPIPEASSTGSEQTFTGLDLGLYYVVETTPATGYDPVLPFLITVPTTDATATPPNSAWVYDVEVTPKNRSITSKQVADADAFRADALGNPGSAGDTVAWTIRGNIEDGAEDLYRITDDLDERLRFIGGEVSLDVDGTVTPLDTADYTVASTPSPTAGDRIVFTLTTSGLAKINAADPATTQVVATVNTTIRSDARGSIENGAFIQQTGDLITQIPPISTKWGHIRVTKESPAGATLGGAAFEVYASHTNDFATASTTGIGGTTASDGTALIGGLRYSDFALGDNVGPSNPAYVYYWLVETQAPAGYELLPQPVPFEITSTNSPNNIVELTVENVPSNGGFILPLTGGTLPTIMFYGVGALLIAGSALLIVRSRRRHA